MSVPISDFNASALVCPEDAPGYAVVGDPVTLARIKQRPAISDDLFGLDPILPPDDCIGWP